MARRTEKRSVTVEGPVLKGNKEPFRWNLHLPYKPLKSTLSRVDLYKERFPKEVWRDDRGKNQ